MTLQTLYQIDSIPVTCKPTLNRVPYLDLDKICKGPFSVTDNQCYFCK